MRQHGESWLAEKPCGNVANVSLLNGIVESVVLVNADKEKRLDHSLNPKSHVDEAINEILVIARIPANVSALHIRGAQRGANGMQRTYCCH